MSEGTKEAAEFHTDSQRETSSYSGETNESWRHHFDDEAHVVPDVALTERSRTSAYEDITAETLARLWSRTSAPGEDVPPMGGNKGYPPRPKNDEMFRVEFDGPDDPASPLNWSTGRKVWLGFVMVYPTTVLVWGSSIYAASTLYIEEIFHVGTPVAVLGVSLYVLGFATGPVLWGPLSEVYGRKLPMILSTLLFTAFTFWTATADHFYQLMLYRFFSGALGAAPLVVVAAAFADMLNTEVRGVGITLFSLCVVAGPMIGPVVGGYIAYSYLGWRWVFYITGIMGALGLVLVALFMEETYHGLILAKKAAKIRHHTGNHFIYAAHERAQPDIKTIMNRVVLTPLIMLIKEPILLLTSLYHGFIYGILYLCLEAVPIVFGEKYQWHQGNVFLPYLGMFIGACVGNMTNIFVFEPYFRRALKASGKPILPEARLPLGIFSGIVFPIGIFLLCWAGNYKVHWIAPVIGMAFIGCGMVGLFLAIINYTIDTYLMFAASAMSANTFVRSAMGAAFPIFATAMFHNLGVQWAGTLLGCLALVLVPCPIFFFLYGARIRKMSKFAPNVAI